MTSVAAATLATRVGVLGFTRFERATFESFFRLSSKRSPAYVPAPDIAQADLIVADADDAAVIRRLAAKGLLARTLVLGATPVPQAACQLPRPVNLMLVLRALDQLQRPSQPSPAASPGLAAAAPARAPAWLPSSSASATHRVLADLASRTGVLPAGFDPRSAASAAPPVAAEGRGIVEAPARRNAAPASARPSAVVSRAAHQLPALPNLPPAPRAEQSSATLDHILVVDDSDVALRFMTSLLQRFGFQIHLARSGEEAIDKVSKRHFEFVFLDVMMEGLDGFQTCKAIKRNTYAGDRPPPSVVMLTSRGTAVDKLRGTMAGCNGYLTKPLQEAELLKLVGDREIARHEYAETAPYANTTI